MSPTLYYTRDNAALAGFQAEPSGRGTIGIIWTCLSTILLSSWSSYHGEAYDPNHSHKSEARGSYGRRFVFAFLLPEAGAVLSLGGLCDALRLRKTIRQVGGPQFARFSLSQAFLFLIDGVRQKEAGSEKMELIGPSELVELVRSGSLSFSDLPNDNEIADRSKSDWTLKSLSIIQTTWFISGIIARLSRGYPVSLYEDITVANAVCGIVEFACWFHCPQDIRLPFTVRPDLTTRLANDPSAAAESKESGRESTVNSIRVSESATRPKASSGSQLPALSNKKTNKEDGEVPITERLSLNYEGTKHRASNTTQSDGFRKTAENTLVAIMIVFSVVFSSIHIAAWNYSFCSLTEAWIWRGGSLALTVVGICLSILAKDDDTHWREKPAIAFGVLYSSVRVAMLVVALMSFREAPARLYETPSWTQYWPHI